MTPSLIIGGNPFYDTPGEIEGSPYWVDLWADVNGYKIGLQIKPSTYKSPNLLFTWESKVVKRAQSVPS